MTSSSIGSANRSTPDLASVLKALSDSYRTVSAESSSTTEQSQQEETPQPLDVISASDSKPRTVTFASFNQQYSVTPSQASAPAHHGSIPSSNQSRIADAAGSARSETPMVDPSTITTWPAALKHVMKTVGQSESLQHTIRKLIRLQHESEDEWWSERNALLEKQRARAGKQKQLDNVLQAIGGAVMKSPATRTAEEDEKELREYDEKTYKQLISLSRSLDRDLRLLGVPFFAIRFELVRQSEPAEPSNPPAAATKGCITAEQLGELQKRMLDLLEDLCKD